MATFALFQILVYVCKTCNIRKVSFHSKDELGGFRVNLQMIISIKNASVMLIFCCYLINIFTLCICGHDAYLGLHQAGAT